MVSLGLSMTSEWFGTASGGDCDIAFGVGTNRACSRIVGERALVPEANPLPQTFIRPARYPQYLAACHRLTVKVCISIDDLT